MTSYCSFEAAFEVLKYPAGERHVRAIDIDALRCIETIEANVRTFDDLALLVTADRILRRNDLAVEWFIPYFPFARHDRRIDTADGLEVELAMQLVDELDLVIADPHSDVTAVLPHFPQDSIVDVLTSLGTFDRDPTVVIPDAGATKKALEWIGSTPHVQALKYRDPRTGHLSRFSVLADDLGGVDCVIVDDICDGGGTFLGLAAELRETHNVGLLHLVITHGLFTKGLDALTDAFDHITTFVPTSEDEQPTTDGRITRVPFRILHEKGVRR